MAIDDVVSDYETEVANGAQMAIQPASGDEWLVTHLVCQSSDWNFRSHTSAVGFQLGAFGGNTGGSSQIGITGGFQRLSILLTNSEYIKLHNGTGSTASAA